MPHEMYHHVTALLQLMVDMFKDPFMMLIRLKFGKQRPGRHDEHSVPLAFPVQFLCCYRVCSPAREPLRQGGVTAIKVCCTTLPTNVIECFSFHLSVVLMIWQV